MVDTNRERAATLAIGKKRRSTKDDWTTVPGWDGVKQEYIELDCEQWIRDNGIREAGRENGKQEFPPADAAQPDDMYAKILDWVNKRGKTCHAEVCKYLNQQRNALLHETTQGIAPIRQKMEGLRDQGKVALTDQGQEDRNILTQEEREAREAWKAFEAFKRELYIYFANHPNSLSNPIPNTQIFAFKTYPKYLTINATPPKIAPV